MRPLRIAHRGASGEAPENTLAAFRRARELDADLVEIDVRAIADGVPVVLHDATLSRTTGGEGSPRDWTLDRLRSLDAGSWFGAKFAGEPVPTLEETLLWAKDRMPLLIEMKEPGLESALVDLLRATGTTGQAVIQSFDAGIVRKVREIEPLLPAGLLLGSAPGGEGGDDPTRRIAEAVLAAGACVAGLSGSLLSAERVDALRRRGLSVWAWTLDDPAVIRSAVEMGVAGIISNYPDRVNQR